MKKILSMILALCMLMSFMTVAFADETVCTHELKYTEIPTSGTHTKSCDECGTSETEKCVGCHLTGGCELCGAKLLGIHPDENNDCHCDYCENPLDHEDHLQKDKDYHWIVCSKDETKIFMKDEHAYGEWTETKAATEDAEGEKVRVCEVCEHEDKAPIEKLPHEHKYTDTVVAPTCEEAGYTKHECKCGYSYKDAEVEKNGHTFSDWKITKQATYKEEGEKTRTCSVATCKKVETEKIEKIAHTCDYESVVTKPTCEKDGYTTKTCKLCGDTQKVEIVSATGHDEKNAKLIDKVEPTCKKTGYSGDLECQECKEIIKKGETVKKIDHKFDSKTDKCTMCGLDKKDYNPKTGDNIMIAVAIMGASMVGLATCAFVYKKKFAYQAKRVSK